MGHAGDRRDRPVRESDPLLRADRRAVILTAKDRVPRHEITRRARFFRYLRSIAHAAAPTLARRAASTSKAVPFNEVRKAPAPGPRNNSRACEFEFRLRIGRARGMQRKTVSCALRVAIAAHCGPDLGLRR